MSLIISPVLWFWRNGSICIIDEFLFAPRVEDVLFPIQEIKTTQQVKVLQLKKDMKEEAMPGRSIIPIVFTNLGPFSANSVITFGVSFCIRWYT